MAGFGTPPRRWHGRWGWAFLIALLFAAFTAAAAQPRPEPDAATRDLLEAAGTNDVARARASIEAGADLDARNQWGQTAAEIAISRGYFQIAHVIAAARNFRREQAREASPAPVLGTVQGATVGTPAAAPVPPVTRVPQAPPAPVAALPPLPPESQPAALPRGVPPEAVRRPEIQVVTAPSAPSVARTPPAPKPDSAAPTGSAPAAKAADGGRGFLARMGDILGGRASGEGAADAAAKPSETVRVTETRPAVPIPAPAPVAIAPASPAADPSAESEAEPPPAAESPSPARERGLFERLGGFFRPGRGEPETASAEQPPPLAASAPAPAPPPAPAATDAPPAGTAAVTAAVSAEPGTPPQERGFFARLSDLFQSGADPAESAPVAEPAATPAAPSPVPAVSAPGEVPATEESDRPVAKAPDEAVAPMPTVPPEAAAPARDRGFLARLGDFVRPRPGTAEPEPVSEPATTPAAPSPAPAVSAPGVMPAAGESDRPVAKAPDEAVAPMPAVSPEAPPPARDRGFLARLGDFVRPRPGTAEPEPVSEPATTPAAPSPQPATPAPDATAAADASSQPESAAPAEKTTPARERGLFERLGDIFRPDAAPAESAPATQPSAAPAPVAPAAPAPPPNVVPDHRDVPVDQIPPTALNRREIAVMAVNPPEPPPPPRPVQASPPAPVPAASPPPAPGAAVETAAVVAARQPAAPRPKPPMLRAPLKGVTLAVGGTMGLGRSFPGDEAASGGCFKIASWTARFCIETIDWPERVRPLFDVRSPLYRGPRAIVRYEADRADGYFLVFATEAYPDITKHLEERFGPPTETWQRIMAVIGGPRMLNDVLIWRSQMEPPEAAVELEIRRYDDVRGMMPDTQLGVVRLRREGSRAMFHQISMADLMLHNMRASTGASPPKPATR